MTSEIMTSATTAGKGQLVRKTFPVGPLQCNCTIIGNRHTRQAMVVDPGGDAAKIMAQVHELGLNISLIIHTHAHLDHFLAAGEIKKATGAPLCLHKKDQPLWNNLETQCRMFGVPYKPQPGPDQWLLDDEELPCERGVCLHTPGHTPGSMSFWFADHKLLIAGDTLFKRSIGRTDLWGGDHTAIIRSIKQRLMVLDEGTTVVTGHGPETTIADELRHNPFIRQA